MHRNNRLLLAAYAALVALLLTGCGSSPAELGQDAGVQRSCEPPTTRGCTIFTVSIGDRVFFAGNDDYIDRDSYYWVDPGSANGYGAIYIGRPDNVQQGVNEMGLAYDANGLPDAPVNSHPGNDPVSGGYTSYPIEIMRSSASVVEVISWVQEHRWPATMRDQMHFTDAGGDAVVISAGPDGQLAFTRKPAGDSFLVSTNYNVADPSNGTFPCWRYSRAESMLQDIRNEDELSAERIASILDAVHVEDPQGWTKVSLVADLSQGLVYIYYFHQFDAPIVLDVVEEIGRAPSPGPLSALFPPDTLARADVAYEHIMAGAASCDIAAYIWLGLVAVSLLIWCLLARQNRRVQFPWIPVVAILGPLGLLVWLISGRSRRMEIQAGIAEPDAKLAPTLWRQAIVETVGDMPPYIVGMILALLIIALVPSFSQDSALQLIVVCGLPLAIGLFLYQGPLLARAARSSYVRTVLHRLPAVLVSSNLAVTGFAAVTLPLTVWTMSHCSLSALTLLSVWASTVLGAIAGGILLFAYHAWALSLDFAAWSPLLRDAGEATEAPVGVSSPSWRRLWLWITLSFVVLTAGIVLGAIGTALAQTMR